MRRMAARVLVIDREPALREMVRLILSPAGYEVVECGTLGTAVEVARSVQPAVVLLDLRIPGRRDRDRVRRLRAAVPGVRVVMMSGSASTEEVRSLGADLLLEKPYRALDLRRCVREALRLPLVPGPS